GIMRPSVDWSRKVRQATRDVYASVRTLLLRTDVRRWRRNAFERPAWDERNRMIAGLIPEHVSVLDLGAGAQTLRWHLKPGCHYQPCDLVKSSDDVLLCDFNAGAYPKTERDYDYVVCSGVLEYIRAPRAFLARIARLGRRVILSYAVARPDDSRWRRLRDGWVNGYSQSELERHFDELGFQWRQTGAWGRQSIYMISRER